MFNITKPMMAMKSCFTGGVTAVASTKFYDIDAGKAVQGAESLPQAPRSAFRKRPVKLTYDKNEFHQFRLPSENTFLLGTFDKEDIFGKRNGVQQSPHIQAQTDLDSSLLWFFGFATFLMMCGEFKPKSQYRALRDNFRNSDMGKFSEEDFN
jgi:hypothetical protein